MNATNVEQTDKPVAPPVGTETVANPRPPQDSPAAPQSPPPELQTVKDELDKAMASNDRAAALVAARALSAKLEEGLQIAKMPEDTDEGTLREARNLSDQARNYMGATKPARESTAAPVEVPKYEGCFGPRK